jgi:hypothetical protein
MATFVSIPRRNSCRDFPPSPAISHSRFSERFFNFGILGILGRETLFADFCRNARPETGSSTTLGPGPSVRRNFLAAWIVGLGHGELAQGPGVPLCLGCIGFSHAFRKYGRNACKPLNIRNACGERLEKRSLHPPPVPARDLPLGVRAYNRYLAWSWAFQGCTRGEPYSENTAEKYCRNAFGNFN